jgi:hypothetical protein
MTKDAKDNGLKSCWDTDAMKRAESTLVGAWLRIVCLVEKTKDEKQ